MYYLILSSYLLAGAEAYSTVHLASLALDPGGCGPLADTPGGGLLGAPGQLTKLSSIVT
jgi:hypothetical protein